LGRPGQRVEIAVAGGAIFHTPPRALLDLAHYFVYVDIDWICGHP
jgi:hypothetical protein